MRATIAWFIVPVALLTIIIFNRIDQKSTPSAPPADPSPAESCGFKWRTTSEPETIDAMKTQVLIAMNKLLNAKVKGVKSVEMNRSTLQIRLASNAWPNDLNSKCGLLERIIRTVVVDGDPAMSIDVFVQDQLLRVATSMHDSKGDYFLIPPAANITDEEIERLTDEVYDALSRKGMTR